MTAASARRRPAPGRVDRTADHLVGLLGGPSNIQQLTYCFTKLRFSLADRTVVDEAALLAHPAVMGLIEDDTYQVIIGPAVVEHVAHAIAALLTGAHSISAGTH